MNIEQLVQDAIDAVEDPRKADQILRDLISRANKGRAEISRQYPDLNETTGSVYPQGYNGTTTIEEVRIRLRKEIADGTTCPCCLQRVQRYKRKLNSGQALFLIGLYRLSTKGKKAPHVDEIYAEMDLAVNTGSDYGVLKMYNVIISAPKDPRLDARKSSSGRWTITDLGKDFVQGFTRLPSHVMTYNGKRLGMSEKRILITEALGDQFDYNELIHGRKAKKGKIN